MGVTNPLINSLSNLVSTLICLSSEVTCLTFSFIVPHCRRAGFICTSLRLSTHLPFTFSSGSGITTSGSPLDSP
ncbi:hypothetical protein 7t3_079 [Salmonella phage 7t3]|nr:hypothetical protein 7t3_079 [Salmonella phage 7t3]